jgi:hypothetical protein
MAGLQIQNLNLIEKVFENLPKYYPGFSNATKRSSPKFYEFLNSYARVLDKLPIPNKGV